jgi:arginine repressor
MWQIIRDSYIAIIKNLEAGGFQALNQASLSKCLRVILASRAERACA